MSGSREFIEDCLVDVNLEEDGEGTGLDYHKILSDIIGAGITLGTGYAAYKGGQHLWNENRAQKAAAGHVRRMSPEERESHRKNNEALSAHLEGTPNAERVDIDGKSYVAGHLRNAIKHHNTALGNVGKSELVSGKTPMPTAPGKKSPIPKAPWGK